jgi:hypothetical protein
VLARCGLWVGRLLARERNSAMKACDLRPQGKIYRWRLRGTEGGLDIE